MALMDLNYRITWSELKIPWKDSMAKPGKLVLTEITRYDGSRVGPRRLGSAIQARRPEGEIKRYGSKVKETHIAPGSKYVARPAPTLSPVRGVGLGEIVDESVAFC